MTATHDGVERGRQEVREPLDEQKLRDFRCDLRRTTEQLPGGRSSEQEPRSSAAHWPPGLRLTPRHFPDGAGMHASKRPVDLERGNDKAMSAPSRGPPRHPEGVGARRQSHETERGSFERIDALRPKELPRLKIARCVAGAEERLRRFPPTDQFVGRRALARWMQMA
jgi:hypothetical protein